MGLTLSEAKDAAWHQAMRQIEVARVALMRLARSQRAATRYKKQMQAASKARRALWGKPQEID
jgi:hypothetical protein